ncbi:hypothetical protein [Microbacterium sp. RG1]|uniref:hypothetical protein n=1 Tax=Microbacterium sp. RG1 TaxID=2489212 RepID=UPI001375F412|nr:hypothetical protein [Microbacterium sp. RG1]
MPHEHAFDPLSGWCARCGLRDDNRLMNHGTEYRPGPDYTPQQLADFLAKGLNA